jgi:hypothetical protein
MLVTITTQLHNYLKNGHIKMILQHEMLVVGFIWKVDYIWNNKKFVHYGHCSSL